MWFSLTAEVVDILVVSFLKKRHAQTWTQLGVLLVSGDNCSLDRMFRVASLVALMATTISGHPTGGEIGPFEAKGFQQSQQPLLFVF